jgi:hypothetical protein
MKTSIAQLATLAASLAIGSVASAQLQSISLPGATDNDTWSALDSAVSGPGYGGFPGSAAWPAPIGSTSGGDAGLMKISNGTGGGPYPATGSIYFGGFSGDLNNNGGTLSVTDSTPVAGLANVVFQIEIGEAWTYDFYNDVLPVLSYTTGSGTVAGLAATAWSVAQVFTGTVAMPTGEEPVYNNTYRLQWDLSGVAETINAFSITFTGVQHAQLYAIQLDQSSVYGSVVSASPVPEPASFAALAGLGVLGLAATRRRGRQ